MLDTAPHIANLAQVIQLAVAPVFLLAGVGTTLNALATRVGRIIDRARTMEDRLLTASPEQADEYHKLLRVLSKRATLNNRAIGLSVPCGFLVSLVVAALLGYLMLLESLGFVTVTFLFLLLLFRLERRGWAFSAVSAGAGAVGTHVLFQLWLKTQLPTGPFGF